MSKNSRYWQMRRAVTHLLLLPVVALLMTGCPKWYWDHPFTESDNVSIDDELLGVWELIRDLEADEVEAAEQSDVEEISEGQDGYEEEEATYLPLLTVLRFSETEYVIQAQFYSSERFSEYTFRGYPVKFEGKSFIQLQIIGALEARDGDIGEHDVFVFKGRDREGERAFHAVTYRISESELRVNILNDSLIDTDLETEVSLRDAFLKNKENKELFTERFILKRVE